MIYRITFWTVWLAATMAITFSLSHHGASDITTILVSIPVSWFIAKLAQLIVVSRVYRSTIDQS